MKISSIKTIDIQAKEWFDKANGNSYFAAIVTINFGTAKAKVIKVSFQYGYGDHYLTRCIEQLKTGGIIEGVEPIYSVSKWCADNNIMLRYSKQERCKKSELINI